MKKRFPFVFVLLVSSLSLAETGNVQEKIRVNLVELEVKATNISGKYLTGLSEEDFTVKENGKTQVIDSFEEVELNNFTDAEEPHEYKSRIMLLLDLSNTSFPVMNQVFPELRDFVQLLYNGISEVGLAVNANGIIEFSTFTTDQEALFDAIDRAENFYKRTRTRSGKSHEYPIYYAESDNAHHAYGLTPGASFNDLYRSGINNRYRNDVEVLGQYVRYLGAYSGKKNLVLISESWRVPDHFDQEGSVDRDGIISLKDIQSTCLYNKIAINVLSLTRGSEITGPDLDPNERPGRNYGNSRGVYYNRSDRYFDRSGTLAAATSGSFIRTPRLQVAEYLDRTILKAERYYRIRYYSGYSGSKFRKISVGIKGLNRIAYNLEGYYPKRDLVKDSEANAQIKYSKNFDSVLNINTDWMYWQWSGWKKRRANYAVAQKAFDDEGNLISEKVVTGELTKKKDRGAYPSIPLQKQLVLDLPTYIKPSRVETTILDLTTGKKVFLKDTTPDKLI